MNEAAAKPFDVRVFDRSLAETADPLPLFRTALCTGRQAIHQRFLVDRDADRLVHALAELTDALLIRAWALHGAKYPPRSPLALVAVGGYGRGELHPHSDIDLLLLTARGDADGTQAFAENLLRFLWDMGLEVGHSVRTLKQCVQESKKDITVATNLMESRLLAGDDALYAKLRAQMRSTRLWPSKKFFSAKWREQIERHRRFDDTAYNLEPNTKEGPGGLRDIQMIAWVTQRHFDTTTLHDLVRHGFLSESEYRTLVRGRNFLWKVRAGLHYLAERREDRLLFDHQRALAQQFGFRDRRGNLAVELFMKQYYRTVKELLLLNEILLQHFQEEILGNRSLRCSTSSVHGVVSPLRARIKPVNRRFQMRHGFLEVTRPKVFERFPFALLELFLIMQQRTDIRGVRAGTIRLVRANLPRINAAFRRDLACRSLFMEILRQPRGITHELRRMNAYGVLGAYLPAFGRIVGQMQHDLFHVYTVDQHTLFVLRNVRRFAVPKFRHEFPLASELMQRLVKPERLYLGALFHDIAKGRGGDHSTLGEQDVGDFCRRHLLSDYDTRFIQWLVRQHLLMSQTAQRQDISDPDAVHRFAQQMGDQEHLDNLYLLTVADMRGTSPAVWNTWKGRLLSQLHSATTRLLRRGIAEPIDLEAHVADLKREALTHLADSKLPPERVERFWADLDADYFLPYDAESLAWHAHTLAAASAADLPLVATRWFPELGGSEFLVYAPDREDLFAVLTAGFDRLNLSIVEARIHTLHNGFALDTFVALDHAGQPVTDPRALEHLRRAMRTQLLDPMPGRDLRGAPLPRTLKQFPIETRVHFTPSTKGNLTIMEVVAQDRPGLLYQVALALSHCRVNLVAAKVSTYGERAEDVFFVNTRERRPLADAEQMKCLENEIVRRLAPVAAIDVVRSIEI
ncbi:MAG: [protein-PII] uridylyltransferase [Gammaproteobacteria bacterium]|nr:[protein-PII] uridylyltransferase [Gammaproteobacteria bacterium]